MRNITSDEYELLRSATSGDDNKMHWKDIWSITATAGEYEETSHDTYGYLSAEWKSSITMYEHGSTSGLRPAFAVSNSDDYADLSVGDVVVMGTLYVGSTPVKVPSTPTKDGDITAYGERNSEKITLGEAQEDTAYQMQAIYVGNGLFVCDRVMLNDLTWKQIETAFSAD